MIRVGLTGGIGSGKTFIANLFIKKEIPVYFSDLRARELMSSSAEIKNELVKKFGPSAYIDEQLNRPLIARRVFNNPDELMWLNRIVHPVVEKDFELWISQQKSAPYVIKEAAILIESGASKTVDYIIAISAPTELKIKRVMDRDGLTKDQVMERIQNQMPDSEKIKQADFVVINDGIQLVEPQVNKIHKHLITIQQ